MFENLSFISTVFLLYRSSKLSLLLYIYEFIKLYRIQYEELNSNDFRLFLNLSTQTKNSAENKDTQNHFFCPGLTIS